MAQIEEIWSKNITKLQIQRKEQSQQAHII